MNSQSWKLKKLMALLDWASRYPTHDFFLCVVILYQQCSCSLSLCMYSPSHIPQNQLQSTRQSLLTVGRVRFPKFYCNPCCFYPAAVHIHVVGGWQGTARAYRNRGQRSQCSQRRLASVQLSKFTCKLLSRNRLNCSTSHKLLQFISKYGWCVVIRS